MSYRAKPVYKKKLLINQRFSGFGGSRVIKDFLYSMKNYWKSYK